MANNIIQTFRTSVAGRQPNTTTTGNLQYIAAGQLALNMPDQILYTSNGTSLIYVGANQVNLSVGNTITVNGSIGTSGQVLTTNGASGGLYWSTVTGGGGSSVDTSNQYIFSNLITFNGGFIGSSASIGNTISNVTITSSKITVNNAIYAAQGVQFAISCGFALN